MDTFSKNFSLEGKVALVTGGAYGIGFAIAEAFAKAGAKIAFNCRSQKHLDQAIADYKAKGIDAKGYIADVTDEAQVKNLVADIEKELGVIDILVNNAGIIKRIPMTEMSVEDFRQVVDIDLDSVKPIPMKRQKKLLNGMLNMDDGTVAMSFDCDALISANV
jgi:gluconate 5-dehydrogenase